MNPRLVFYFDYVDPASYLFHRWLRSEGVASSDVELVGIEVAEPPFELIDAGSEPWRAYCDEVATIGGADAPVPALRPVPWTRKAHELSIHARGTSSAFAVHEALFSAYFERSLDLGRVDVLVGIAAEVGLDAGAAKAVLDVDKHTEVLLAERTNALEAGLRRVPTLRRGPDGLEGPVPIDDLRAFLARSGDPGPDADSNPNA